VAKVFIERCLTRPSHREGDAGGQEDQGNSIGEHDGYG
jgi:hypothetical protein